MKHPGITEEEMADLRGLAAVARARLDRALAALQRLEELMKKLEQERWPIQ